MRTEHLSRRAERILTSVLPPTEGVNIVNQVNTWLRCNGPSWTVNRLKAFYVAALQLRAQDPSKVIEIYQSNSISYRKDNLLPRGVFQAVVWRFVHAQTPTALRNCLAVLRLYTSILLDDLTDAQYTKALHAINDPCTAQENFLINADRLIGVGIKATRIADAIKEPRQPDVRRLKPFTSTHSHFEPEDPSFWRYISFPGKGTPTGRKGYKGKKPFAPLVWSLCTTCWIPDSLKEINPCEDFRLFLERIGTDNESRGHIGFIQEPGAKARVVAVSNAWLQWLYEPCHQVLDQACKTLPNSSMHDQNLGAWFIQDNLNKGNTLYCYDLSSATDRFPRDLQVSLLRRLGLDAYADGLEDITWTEWWSYPKDRLPDIWKYETGQPMGLYSSFPLFHLTHYLLIEGLRTWLNSKKGLNIPSDSYRVLGDDVVISDLSLARWYKAYMQGLGVSLSETKSVVSNQLAEFAGFVGIKTTKGTTVFRPYRYGKTSSTHARYHISNEVCLLHSCGHKLQHRSKTWKVKYERFRRAQNWRNPDLSPIFTFSDKENRKVVDRLDPTLLSSQLYAALELSPFGKTWAKSVPFDMDLEEVAYRFCNEAIEVRSTREIYSPADAHLLDKEIPGQFETDPLISNADEYSELLGFLEELQGKEDSLLCESDETNFFG